jgi:hypothetical protein
MGWQHQPRARETAEDLSFMLQQHSFFLSAATTTN